MKPSEVAQATVRTTEVGSYNEDNHILCEITFTWNQVIYPKQIKVQLKLV